MTKKPRPRRDAKTVGASRAAATARAADGGAAQEALLELEPRLTIAGAAELHRALVARLARGGPIVVDGTRVAEIDTAILQLLASLWRTGRERGIACTWQGASAALRDSANLIGVARIMQLADAGSARDGGRAAL